MVSSDLQFISIVHLRVIEAADAVTEFKYKDANHQGIYKVAKDLLGVLRKTVK